MPLREQPTAKLDMNHLSLRNNHSKFKTSGKSLFLLDKSMDYTSN